ncbi:MAG TPA: NifB/NifX family molybdenum-iron cluster-binding protein [Terriglobia bacterium]|nr:NifB/NifX family molybdenum-iron cluster-binding protein [Terriglobia bacterium]
MKVAFTISGNDLNAPLDNRFGRAPKFLVYDLDSETFKVAENQQNLNTTQRAGIQSAETVARLGAGSFVTRHCGPKAFRVLSAAEVKIYTTDVPLVAATLEQCRLGKLAEARSADTEGHWV